MKEQSNRAGVPLLVQIGLSVGVAAIGLALMLVVVLAQAPNFDSSYKTGPLFADTNDVITYTIVALNTGALEQDVVLSDTLPVGAVFISSSCTYITQTGSAQTCGPLSQMWQKDFDTGDRITTTFAVQATAGTMRWPLVNCAYLSWDSSQKEMCFTTTVNPARQYIPLVTRNFISMPDLRAISLTVEPASPTAGEPVTVTVVVQNVGEVPAGPFWVDLYDNPDPPPEEANQIWNLLCSGSLRDCYGIAWYVAGGLGMGQSVTLSSLAGYQAQQTHWPGYFVASGGHALYAFADTWNWGVWYGAVEERNENLDNRYGPVSINVAIGTGGGALGATDGEIYIPWRPNRP